MISPTLDPWSVTNLRSVIEARAVGKVMPDAPLIPAFFSFDEGAEKCVVCGEYGDSQGYCGCFAPAYAIVPSPGVCDACGEPIGPFGCPGCR